MVCFTGKQRTEMKYDTYDVNPADLRAHRTLFSSCCFCVLLYVNRIAQLIFDSTLYGVIYTTFHNSKSFFPLSSDNASNQN